MKRTRNILFKGFTFLCLVSLISCSEKDRNSSISYKSLALNSIKPTQLKFLGHWLGEGKKENFVKEFVNEFEFKNQDIQVVTEYPEHIYYKRENYHCEDKFIIKQVTAKESEWDIIRLNNIYQGIVDETGDKDWAKKYLVDFSEIPEFRTNALPEVLTESIKANWGGIIPGPVNESYLWALWYNKDVAKKIGISIKQFGMTFDDFIGYIQAIDNYNKKNKTDIIPIYDTDSWPTAVLIAEQLFFSEINDFNEVNNKNYSEKKLTALKKVLTALEKLSIYNPISPDRKNSVWEQQTNYPLKEKCLFYCNAMWMYTIWQKEDSATVKKMIPAEFPVFKTTNACPGGYWVIWAVPKNAPHKEQAIKFLLSMNNADVAEKWARYTKSPSGIAGGLTSFDISLDQFEKFYYNMSRKYGKNKFPLTTSSEYYLGERNRAIPVKAVEIMEGSITAEENIRTIERQLRR